MPIDPDSVKQILSSGVTGVAVDGGWVAQGEIVATLHEVITDFDREVQLATKRLAFVFWRECDSARSTAETTQLIHDWHKGEDLFSAASMVAAALEPFGFIGEDGQIEQGCAALVRGMLAASVLAEVPNTLPYHNNLHFRKVLLHVLRMVAVHNYKIFSGTAYRLDHGDIARLIVAACIHDIGHEGKGNFVDHKYHMAMIEKRSFAYAKPYQEAAGLDEGMLDDIRVMLITTDVSPVGDPISPVNQLRAAYEYHFGMDESTEGEGEGEPALAEELAVLAEDSHLCALCVMLQEADIMNSAGVDYDITRFESMAVSKEIGLSHSLPEDTWLFLETICRGRMLSDAARYLAEDNLDQIIKQVMADLRKGNRSYL